MRGQDHGRHMATLLGWRMRYWAQRLHRLRLSLGQRGWRGTLARIAQELRPRRRGPDASLALVPLDDAFAPFALPVSATPAVSVIIPAHGQSAHTVACLRSIARHAAHAAFEVIVVDDASPDDTAAVLACIGGLRVVSHPDNRGFVDSCNDGAAAARGEVLLFLNNDTQVTPGWLDALLACLHEEADCGIVGSRLVWPDGRLQEAGGLVHDDGTGINIGRFAGRHDPRYRFRREVDYVSGASLMIPRALFEKVGGFARAFAPAYYEDTDLAFAVRAAGRRVMYEPASVIVHDEGTTAGRDPTRGVKRYQARHRERLRERHAAALRSHSRPGTPVERGLRRYRRGHILVIDAMVPEPSRDSGSLRLTEIFRLLHAMRWQVTFVPDDERIEEQHVQALGALGVELRAGGLLAWLRRHGEGLDAVMLCRAATAASYLPMVRRLAPGARVIFDTVDLHFLRESRAAEASGKATLARHARATRRRELALVEQADATLVVSPVERELLAEAAPGARVELLSNIHVLHGRRRGFHDRRDLVFIGGYGHPPNADALHWLADEILPAIRRRAPSMQLHVLGDVPDTARRALDRPGLVFHGRVTDLAPFMDSCRLSVAPLRFGAGVKGKVNMAMSHGLPVVATRMAAEGMHLVDGQDVRIADDAEAFVDAVLELHEDPGLWLRLSDGGLENVRRHFSPDAAAATLRRVLDGAAIDRGTEA